MRLSKADVLVTGVLLSTIILFSWLTYRHFNQRVEKLANAQSVGTVRYKYNKVKRKFSGRFIWEDVQSLSPVYLNDSIVTGEASDALVRLESGLEIELESNSLVKLDVIEDKIGLKLERGVIRASDNSKEASVPVQTSSGLLINIQNSDVILRQDENSSKIFVKRGSVQVDGQSEAITSGKIFELKKDGSRSLKEVQIIGLKPVDGSLMLTENLQKMVRFQWNTAHEIKEYDLYLSRDPIMKNKRVIRVRSKNYKTRLGRGKWYWQVLSHDDPRKFVSSIQSFSLERFQPIETIFPLSNPFIVRETDKSILFKWKLPREGSTVKFSLASDHQFRQTIKKEILSSTSVLVKGLKKGKYYWRVELGFGKKVLVDENTTNKNIDTDTNVNIETTANNINQEKPITTKENIPAARKFQKALAIPENLKPSSDLLIPAGLDKDIRFHWNPVADADKYQIQIYLNEETEPTVDQEIQPNEYSFPIPWETRRLRWEVSAIRYAKGSGLLQRSKKSQVIIRVNHEIPDPPKILSVSSKIIY